MPSRPIETPARDLAFAPAGEPRPATIAAGLAAFFVVWTAYLAIVNAPFPILHDMAEAYVWGREFQFGYNQHPPFWAWICGAWFLVMPRTGWAFAALGTLNATIGLAGAWALIGEFASGAKRRAAFSLLLLTPFYTFGCYKYDANTIFLSIWPWTLYFCLVSLRDRRRGPAIGFGICLGLAFLSKYYAAMLLATCALGALATPFRRAYVRSASPWISALVATAIVAPHVVWLLTHEAPPLRYLALVSGRGFSDIAGQAAMTGLVSLASLLPAAALILGFARGAAPQPDGARANFAILVIFACAPLALTLIAGLALRTKLTPEMPIGTFSLVPLFLIEATGARGVARLSHGSFRLAMVFLVAMLVASPAIMLGRTWLWGNADKIAPSQEIAAEATRLWRERTGTPLSYVAGRGYENSMVFYSPDRAHVFYGFDYSKNLWVTPERLARDGLLSVCLKDDGDCLADAARFATPRTTRIEISVAHRFWRHIAKTYDFVLTMTPPE